jgi:hypothetical protein
MRSLARIPPHSQFAQQPADDCHHPDSSRDESAQGQTRRVPKDHRLPRTPACAPWPPSSRTPTHARWFEPLPGTAPHASLTRMDLASRRAGRNSPSACNPRSAAFVRRSKRKIEAIVRSRTQAVVEPWPCTIAIKGGHGQVISAHFVVALALAPQGRTIDA